MSGSINIIVCTALGDNQPYSIDIGINIGELLKYIVSTHISLKTTNIETIDWNMSKLVYNGKTLDHSKTLEEYTEFQYKQKSAYKIQIILSIKMDDRHPTRPIIIKNNSSNKLLADANNTPSMSFPSTNLFLERHINRMDKKNKELTLKHVSASLSDISNWVKDLSENNEPCNNLASDKLDQIINLLQALNTKLDKVIDSMN